MATIKDVANALGIAYSTVSRALNDHPHTSEAMKKRVRDAAIAMGYVPNTAARLMRGSPGMQIGLIVPDIQNYSLFATCAKVLADHCSKLGYQLVLSISDDNPETELRHVQAMREAQVAGLVIAASAGTLPETKRLLAAVPAVQLALRNNDLNIPSVTTEDHEGFHSAARYLIQLGHRRIAFLGGPGALTTSANRVAGVKAAMVEEAIPIDESLLVSVPLRADAARTATSALLQLRQPPTAIIAGNSVLAVGALDAISRAGAKVPKALSFIGCGDGDLFRLWGPGVTTLNAPLEWVSETAFSLLQAQIADPLNKADGKTRLAMGYDLILRGTTAPAS
ncbi:LacI family DNA-binding transcriptional regulator [Sphingomonas crusticola]|uniref:LacI family DNA-binding transcriptional regulator n=1 Tax=Sphingomonas crusticola TaxID=1697973 RepID=UPI000E2383A2|nr:LacI family DNA-binding transcriptional regulator [Sphingomonas crusticola]